MSIKTRIDKLTSRAGLDGCQACKNSSRLQVHYEGDAAQESGLQNCPKCGKVLPVTKILVRYESGMEARQ
jgi:hypothetical protein